MHLAAPLFVAAALALSACASLSPSELDGAIAGKTAVVTGASSGFGKGVALALGQRRANVVLVARRADALEAVAAQIRAGGGRALVVPTDVSDPAQVARLAQAATAEFGRVDVWINNAGVGALGNFEDVPVEDHARIVDVNLNGVIYGSWHAMRLFEAQGGGTLINMGSVVGRVPMPYYASYVATKHGVVGLTAALNQEIRVRGLDGVKAVAVTPHAADTPWFDHAGNYSGRNPRRLPRAILADDPQIVVDAVVHAVARPRPRVAPGIKAKAGLVAHRVAPNLTEWAAGKIVHGVQMAPPPEGAPAGPNSLHRPQPTGTTVDAGIRPPG